MSEKRQSIDLKTKYNILQEIESGTDYTSIMIKYNLKSRSVISRIKTDKEVISNAFELNQNKCNRKRLKQLIFEDIDEAVFKWFTIARTNNIPINGPLIQAQALKMAEELGYKISRIETESTDDLTNDKTFYASNGWLTRFKNRHSISFGTISGESGSVDLN